MKRRLVLEFSDNRTPVELVVETYRRGPPAIVVYRQFGFRRYEYTWPEDECARYYQVPTLFYSPELDP
jgi:hypothetical protein